MLPIRFQTVDSYTTFAVEYAVSDGDIIFHFYPTLEVQKMAEPKKYWIELFPSVLDPTAQAHFQAKASWWMRAFGFGMVLEPHQLAHNFFDKLDQALEAALK